ncbi:uncharacterized protein FIBRA_02437 [Fibroporia radiculosa]|uniref:adenosylmethionine decarboxylase n=1 Tax=Fibroporia radiculosa TaxID=599839 RepID=J4HUY4_9APHY|nr:uncharacterized protein FIBRA_02437 [Fibroporia radiculosa]CCM00407.1 predicted protein [Fibroporia radiculosa]
MATDHDQPTGPFEGPEKLLEIWFCPSPADVPDAHVSPVGKPGLRKVPREVWAEMLDIVKCKILSVVEGMEMDAYLLSESSLFISPHRLILKTCGTTLNLLGLPRILEIAKDHACLPSVYRCFYSRKAFMFPERQVGPHREWKAEIDFLDQIFPNGAAYTVGKVNGDHWLLYMSSPDEDAGANPALRSGNSVPYTTKPPEADLDRDTAEESQPTSPPGDISQDYTIEILMSQLSPKACAPFMTSSLVSEISQLNPLDQAIALSSSVGISDLFPAELTTLDAYSFIPCGYSSNALLRWKEDSGAGPARSGEGYYSIHVTPEPDWSYASFECNVPLPTLPNGEPRSIPDLKTLVRRVVNIFQPGKLTLTLFVSSKDNNTAEEEDGESAVEAAQRAFKAALITPLKEVDGPVCSGSPAFGGVYKRTDKINYEFGGYDLAFATFELRS